MSLGPDEFARLLRQHLPHASRLAVRLCGDVHAAEDVVGEAMLRAARHYRGFRGESAFGTWLYRIVVNAFRDSLRRRSDVANAHETAFDHLEDHAPHAADQAAAAELSRRVAASVSALPPRQREALVLTVYEGLSSEEAAGVMETTAQNVRVLVHHARTRLKQELGLIAEATHD